MSQHLAKIKWIPVVFWERKFPEFASLHGGGNPVWVVFLALNEYLGKVEVTTRLPHSQLKKSWMTQTSREPAEVYWWSHDSQWIIKKKSVLENKNIVLAKT